MPSFKLEILINKADDHDGVIMDHNSLTYEL